MGVGRDSLRYLTAASPRHSARLIHRYADLSPLGVANLEQHPSRTPRV